MTFDNTFSTPISVLKFMYDTEKKVSNLLTSPLSNIISTFVLETNELVVANETIPVPKSSVNVEPNANYLDKIVLVFKNYVSTTGKTYLVYSKITEIQDELFVVSVISTEYFNELSLNPRGAWISGNEYHINDIVNSNNALYICIKSIALSTTRPENDTEHFSLWMSAPTTTGSVIKSVTYDNTNIHQHADEIFSKINTENGGTLQSIHFKPSINVTLTRTKLTINSVGNSSFSTDNDIVLSKLNGYTLIPSEITSNYASFVGNIDNNYSILEYDKILGTWTIKFYSYNILDNAEFTVCTTDMTNLNLEHLTINYKE